MEVALLKGNLFGNPKLPHALKTLRTLVVEDNEINIKVASYLLAKLGHTADTALCGEDALKLCRSQQYHVILMDCHMPGIDGFETTAAIRRLELAANVAPVYIVAVTADVGNGSRERCLAAGMNDYISKPLHLKEFETVMERVANLAEENAFCSA
jgi:CheY-like chemotaxis protein